MGVYRKLNQNATAFACFKCRCDNKNMNHRKIFHNGHYLSANIDQSLKEVRNSKYSEIKCDDEDAIDYHYETADIFLHGSCQLFSLALHNIFGYDAYKITWDGLHKHYFCMIDLDKTKIYIDVRGMTTDFNEFVRTFCPGLLYIPYSIEPQNIAEDEDLNAEGDVTGYAFANEIIERYQSFYVFG